MPFEELEPHLKDAKELIKQGNSIRERSDKLNKKPRKRLGFKTLLEYICMQIKQTDRLC